MKYSGRASNLFATFIGLFFVFEGIWGLNSDIVLWIFTTNTAHAIIHLLLGITGLVLAWAGYTKGFNLFLGILLLAIGVLRFVPRVDGIIVYLLNVNPAVAYLNIAVGLIALIIVFGTRFGNPNKPKPVFTARA